MTIETDITDYIEQVNARDSFIQFIELLKNDFIANKCQWENQTLDSYLDGLSGFTMGLDGYCKNNNISKEIITNPWRLFAEILLAASIYE